MEGTERLWWDAWKQEAIGPPYVLKVDNEVGQVILAFCNFLWICVKIREIWHPNSHCLSCFKNIMSWEQPSHSSNVVPTLVLWQLTSEGIPVGNCDLYRSSAVRCGIANTTELEFAHLILNTAACQTYQVPCLNHGSACELLWALIWQLSEGTGRVSNGFPLKSLHRKTGKGKNM